MKACGGPITIRDALRIKSAEFWLKLGQPFQALSELQGLTERGREHPWAAKVFRNAWRAAQRV
ncbi:MAG TPA: hypothetical protein VN578_01940 [Candidatus Binatia bacterium]|jgi:hypothetical protein|nr:hypothetical protein [Candidatus Binatia bacterium]